MNDAPDSAERLHAGRAWPSLQPTTVLFILAVCVLAVVYVQQMLGYHTTADPDPDGYVTYARHLQEQGSLLDFRRMPGYPAFLAIIDAIGPSTMHADVYYAQIGLSLIVFLLSVALIARAFGKAPALVYAALLAFESYVAFASTVMLSDFLLAVVGQLVLFAGAMALLSPKTFAPTWLAAFAFLVFTAVAIHIGFAAQLFAFLAAAALIWALAKYCRWPAAPPSFVQNGLYKIAAMGLITVLVQMIASATLIPAHPGRDAVVTRFYNSHLTYFMVSCLPPAHDTALDREVEAAKRGVEEQLGYPPNRSRPIRMAPAWLELVERHGPQEVGPAYWRERAIHAPLNLVGCAANELLARYEDVAKNFSPFSSQAQLVNTFRPPFHGDLASRTYWRTGIYAPAITDNASASDNAWTFAKAFARVLLVLALIVGGAVVLVRRFPFIGSVYLLGGVIWTAMVASALVLDARYLTVLALGIYLLQALALCSLAGLILGAFRKLARRAAPSV